MIRLRVLSFTLLLATAAGAHWADHPELPDWAQRGRLNWALHYSRTTRELVDLFAAHHQTLIHGGNFDSPETAAYAASKGLRYMPYVCSRTFTTTEIAQHPQLAQAMLLSPDRTEFLAYGNPVRRYGSLFAPEWPEYVRQRTARVQDLPGTAAVFYDNVYVNEDHRRAAIVAWQAWARQHGIAPGDDMPPLRDGPLQGASRAFSAEALVAYYRGLSAFNRQHDPPLLLSPNLGSLPGYGMAIVEGGGSDLVFYETMSHPPFERNAVRYKVGLASSHGRPTGILAYLPPKIGEQRGEKTWHEGMHSFFYPSSPLPEEFALAVAEAAACGGTYIPAYNLFPSLPITDLQDPFCRRIHHALRQSYTFLDACGELNTAGRPGSSVGLLYSSLTTLHDHRAQNLTALGDALTAAGLPYTIVSSQDLTADGLAGIETLVVPHLAFVDEATVNGLLEYVQRGGTVILTGAYATSDPLGRPAAFPAAQAMTTPLRLVTWPLREWQLDGFELETANLVKVVGGVGRATRTFDGPAGTYRAYLRMLDENDGTSTWRLSVGETTVAEGRLDREDNQLRWMTTPPFALKPGETLRLTVEADGGELGRAEALSLCSGDRGAALGRGRVSWSPTGLEEVPADELAALLPTPVRLSRPGQVAIDHQRSDAGWQAVHLVNYDFRYEVERPGVFASDDGTAEARAFFSGRPVVLRKRLAVEALGEVTEPVITLQVTSTANCIADLVLTLNGQPAGRLPVAGARGWIELPVDAALLRPENVIEVRAEGDLDLNRWCQIGIDTDAPGGGSEYSEDGGATFTAADLSPDLKEQRGEFLIRIVDRRPDGVVVEPGNLVANGGFDAIRVPHAETRLSVVPAEAVEVVTSNVPPQSALLIAPDHAPVWLAGVARGNDAVYTVPQVRIHAVLLLHPNRAALEPFAARQTAAATWAMEAPDEPLRPRVTDWEPYLSGFVADAAAGHARPGSVTCRNESPTDQRGAMQTIVLNQQAPGPVTVKAWSRAEGVSGAADGHYSVYVDAACTDGTVYHGRNAPFSTGSHGWEEATLVLESPKPIASLKLYLLFRNHTGQAWFDDVSLVEGG